MILSPRTGLALLATATAALALASCGGGDSGPPTESPLGATGCAGRANNSTDKLLECVTLAGVRAHQAELQKIADANGSTRVSGSPGYDKSVDYAEKVFKAAGYNVTRQAFEFQTFVSLSPSQLDQVAPPPAGPLPHNIMSYSGSGDVTAPVSVPSGDIRGCDAADFAGFPAGNIALMQRGTPAGFPVACTFALKTLNALAAGASAVVIYNNIAGPLNGTLGNTFTANIPAVGIEQTLGQTLALTAASPGLTLHVKTETLRGIATTYNLFAESRSGDANNVVMVGAHLDSVNAGPGINDNGSGSAAILETARQMARVIPRNKVRFALWGAEESSLVGSTYYIANLPEAERKKIALYLNFDMIGSPNYVFQVYDGDNSDGVGAPAGPPGSAEIEKVFEKYYTERGIPFRGTDFTGRSDYGPFIAVGIDIPAGGLFTGAEVVKTSAEQAIWGGQAGAQYDPCYHQACDTYDNNSDTALDVNSDAVAYATLRFAMNTQDVNGQRGKGNFWKKPPDDPEEEKHKPVAQ
jgi:Zn-dependent M28 family amino/carboxypeptidase